MPVDYLSIIDRKQLLFKSTSDFIWEHPETAFTEYESAACLLAALREEGFEVEEGLAGIPTAFLGRFGSGRPVIGILGEFDALSGLGQESPATERSPGWETLRSRLRPQPAWRGVPRGGCRGRAISE